MVETSTLGIEVMEGNHGVGERFERRIIGFLGLLGVARDWLLAPRAIIPAIPKQTESGGNRCSQACLCEERNWN